MARGPAPRELQPGPGLRLQDLPALSPFASIFAPISLSRGQHPNPGGRRQGCSPVHAIQSSLRPGFYSACGRGRGAGALTPAWSSSVGLWGQPQASGLPLGLSATLEVPVLGLLGESRPVLSHSRDQTFGGQWKEDIHPAWLAGALLPGAQGESGKDHTTPLWLPLPAGTPQTH